MKLKKLVSVGLVAAMTMSLLTACGSKEEEKAPAENSANTEQSTEDSAEPSGKDVTLKTVSMFAGTDANAPVYQEINEQFMEEHTNVTIQDDSQNSDEEWKAKIAADFSVGNEPDVLQFFVDATANAIVATDKLMTIEEIQAEYPDYAKDTFDNALDAVKNTDGVRRAVPTTGYWEGLFCNKALFDQYNVEVPTDWDSLTKAIKTFKDNGVAPFAVSLNAVPHYFVEHTMLYTAGVDEYAQVPEKAPASWAEGLKVIQTLRDMGAFPVDTDTVDEAYAIELFNQGKAAMILDGNWRAGGLKDQENTVVVPFPGVPNQKAEAGTMISGISSGFYISRKAWEDPDKRDAAVKFVMAHTSKEGVQKYWEANGMGVAATEVTPSDDTTPLGLLGIEYAKAATAMVTPTDARIDPEAYKTLINGIVGVSTGSTDSQQLLDEVLALSAQRKPAAE